MKIAIVADTITSGFGGGVISGQRFMTELQKNHEVTLVSADLHSTGIQLPTFLSRFITLTRRGHFIIAFPKRRLIQQAFENIDIVHLQFPFWLSFVALKEARKRRLPVVAAFHVQPENLLHNAGIRSSWLNRKIYQFWVKHLWNHADLIVCPSEFAKNKLLHYQVKTPIAVISNGVPAPTTLDQVSRDPVYQDYFLIIMVGRLSTEKKQETLLEALKYSRYAQKIKLVIAGRGFREKKLRRLAKDLPVEVEMGYISEEKKQQLLATADLFVHCSEVELEGIALLEAMHAGLPVLAAEGPETAAGELVSENFRFPVGNARHLAAKIDWLIEHPEVLTEARHFYRKMSNQLHLEKSVESLVREYQLLVSPTSVIPR